MTKTQAIKLARDRVKLVNQGDQYTVHRLAPHLNATWVSHPMDYWTARDHAREEMLREALEAMGVEDAGEKAHGFTFEHEGRWTDRFHALLRKESL